MEQEGGVGIENKKVFIFRGVPGSGKSSLGETVVELALMAGLSAAQFEADQYFTDANGKYSFAIDKIKEAHEDCFRHFCEAIDSAMHVVVLSNTSSQEWEFRRYKEYAEEKGYIVFVSVVEHRHGNGDVHNINPEVRKRMIDNLKTSFKPW